MKFTSITFPAQGGPQDGNQIEGKGMLCDDGSVAWPGGMWLSTGHFYALKFDENNQPTHFEYDGTKNKPPRPDADASDICNRCYGTGEERKQDGICRACNGDGKNHDND